MMSENAKQNLMILKYLLIFVLLLKLQIFYVKFFRIQNAF